MTDYKELNACAKALTEGVGDNIANLANISALLFQMMENISWAGFYIAKDGEKLVLGPFQGRPACTEIMCGRGVCGTAMERKTAVVVEDVHLFPGHIACDPRSRSEIVIPIFREGTVFGVLDIDSEEKGRFTDADREGLTALVKTLEEVLV